MQEQHTTNEAKRKAARERIEARRLGAQERANLERERHSQYADHQAPADSYTARSSDDLMTFAEWQALRRSDKHKYERESRKMAMHRELLGKDFYDEQRTGSEIYMQKQVDVTDEKLELTIFGTPKR